MKTRYKIGLWAVVAVAGSAALGGSLLGVAYRACYWEICNPLTVYPCVGSCPLYSCLRTHHWRIILDTNFLKYTDMNAQPIAVKFVHWDVCSLDALKNSRVYNLRVRLNNGEKMSRKDKNWLAENLRNNAYFRTAVPLSGYRFDFSDVIRKYVVNQDGAWSEYYAPDKTSLRAILSGTIYHIIEIKGSKIKIGEYK